MNKVQDRFKPGWYMDPLQFSSSGYTKLHWVMQVSGMSGIHAVEDKRVGLVLDRDGAMVFIPYEEFAVLSDLFGGIVRRGKLS